MSSGVRAPIRSHRRLLVVIAAGACVLGLNLAATLACGPLPGQPREAPYVIAPDEDTGGCPSSDDALEKTRTTFEVDERLQRLGPHVERILFKEGGLKVLLPAVLRGARSVAPERALQLTVGYSEERGLARLRPHLGQVLAYLTGTSPYVEGEHYEAVGVVYDLLSDRGGVCDGVANLGTLRQILELETENDDGEVVPWIEPFFDAAGALVEDEVFQETLDRIQFEEEAGQAGEIAVGRNAYQLVMRLVVANIAEPSFEPDYVRGLLEDLLVFQVPEEGPTRERARKMLDAISVLLDPEAPHFASLQQTAGCLAAVDEAGELSGMTYDYLSIEELSLTGFLADVEAFADDEAGQAAQALFEDGVGAILEQEQLGRDVLLVITKFLAPDVRRDVVSSFALLEGTGVYTELVELGFAVVHGCSGGRR